MQPKIITRVEREALKAAAKDQPPQITGAGDAFAIVAQPIARIIDKVAGTDIEHCGGCKKRRAAWNKAIPFIVLPRVD